MTKPKSIDWDELKNPYPEDIFLPISDDDFGALSTLPIFFIIGGEK